MVTTASAGNLDPGTYIYETSRPTGPTKIQLFIDDVLAGTVSTRYSHTISLDIRSVSGPACDKRIFRSVTILSKHRHARGEDQA